MDNLPGRGLDSSILYPAYFAERERTPGPHDADPSHDRGRPSRDAGRSPHRTGPFRRRPGGGRGGDAAKRRSTARANSRPTSSSWTSGCRAWTASRRRARSCRPRPSTKVILITIDESRGAISQAIQAGVSGYLLKDASADALVDAARNAIEGNAVIHPQLTRTFIEEVRMGDPALGHDAALQARARDPPAGRRRRHDQAGRERSRHLARTRSRPTSSASSRSWARTTGHRRSRSRSASASCTDASLRNRHPQPACRGDRYLHA